MYIDHNRDLLSTQEKTNAIYKMMKKLRMSLCKSKGNPFQLIPMRPEMIALLNKLESHLSIVPLYRYILN
jgi:hypothetical protein